MHLAPKPSKLNQLSTPVPYQYLENTSTELSMRVIDPPVKRAQVPNCNVQRWAPLLRSLLPRPQRSLNRMGSTPQPSVTMKKQGCLWQQACIIAYYILLHHITSTSILHYHHMTFIWHWFLKICECATLCDYFLPHCGIAVNVAAQGRACSEMVKSSSLTSSFELEKPSSLGRSLK